MKKLILSVLILCVSALGFGCSDANDTSTSNNETPTPEEQEEEVIHFRDFAQVYIDNATVPEDDEELNSQTVHVMATVAVYQKDMANAYNNKAIQKNIQNNEWFQELGNVFGFMLASYPDYKQGYWFGDYGMHCLHDIKTEYALFPSDYEKFLSFANNEMCMNLPNAIDTTASGKSYSDGQYLVGKDIPAGDYLVTSTSSIAGYLCVANDANGNDIVFNDNFEYNRFINVRDGEFLTLSRAKAAPCNSNTTIDINSADMLRVGIDIGPGMYKLQTTGNQMGYYCVYSDKRQSNIITNDNFNNQTYVSVSSGNYLVISRCYIAERYN